MNTKNILKIIGILFCLAAVCFGVGTVNHIVNTGEGIVSSICLTLGCICGAVACFTKK